MTRIAFEVVATEVVPPRGWVDLPDADERRAENLRTLGAGGSLLDCAPTRVFFSGVLFHNGRAYCHPDTVRRLVKVGGLN